MNYKQSCLLLLLLVFFGCTKSETIENEECLLPEDYGLVDFVEPSDLAGWQPYQNSDTISFIRQDALKKSFVVSYFSAVCLILMLSIALLLPIMIEIYIFL